MPRTNWAKLGRIFAEAVARKKLYGSVRLRHPCGQHQRRTDHRGKGKLHAAAAAGVKKYGRLNAGRPRDDAVASSTDDTTTASRRRKRKFRQAIRRNMIGTVHWTGVDILEKKRISLMEKKCPQEGQTLSYGVMPRSLYS